MTLTLVFFSMKITNGLDPRLGASIVAKDFGQIAAAADPIEVTVTDQLVPNYTMSKHRLKKHRDIAPRS